MKTATIAKPDQPLKTPCRMSLRPFPPITDQPSAFTPKHIDASNCLSGTAVVQEESKKGHPAHRGGRISQMSHLR
ncbi:hypothetical protein JTE90_023243 [Oedothorax gibbosus]|uniref:Uncharacterized protein n=1 Tax=Oedothorax gibbosus TaxID=931172 RepID=A0AAV6TPR0_9ARAC|nr:hypothetical protein JTE90_023243 [Oedothorax gibbosus]